MENTNKMREEKPIMVVHFGTNESWDNQIIVNTTKKEIYKLNLYATGIFIIKLKTK